MYIKYRKGECFRYKQILSFDLYEDKLIITYQNGSQDYFGNEFGAFYEIYDAGRKIAELKGIQFDELPLVEQYKKFEDETGKWATYKRDGKVKETRAFLEWKKRFENFENSE
ncbi:MAG: hypothetical protein ACTSQ8_08060 [Candidatus Helarchaeota archaeon]